MDQKPAKQQPAVPPTAAEWDQHIEGLSPRRQAFSRSVVRVAEGAGHFLG